MDKGAVGGGWRNSCLARCCCLLIARCSHSAAQMVVVGHSRAARGGLRCADRRSGRVSCLACRSLQGGYRGLLAKRQRRGCQRQVAPPLRPSTHWSSLLLALELAEAGNNKRHTTSTETLCWQHHKPRHPSQPELRVTSRLLLSTQPNTHPQSFSIPIYTLVRS